MTDQSDVPSGAQNEPAWLARIKKASAYAVALAIGALLTWLGGIADNLGKVFDRFKTPEAFVLAENSAKSVFSDQFSQRAWRRLFWADNFQAPVIRHAPIADIDLSWKNYNDTDAEWNANLMISIVGLEHYYGTKRSHELEGPIQDMFGELDGKLGALRQSEALKTLRQGQEPTTDQQKNIEAQAGDIKIASAALRNKLYILVRCFSEKERQKNLCAD